MDEWIGYNKNSKIQFQHGFCLCWKSFFYFILLLLVILLFMKGGSVNNCLASVERPSITIFHHRFSIKLNSFVSYCSIRKSENKKIFQLWFLSIKLLLNAIKPITLSPNHIFRCKHWFDKSFSMCIWLLNINIEIHYRPIEWKYFAMKNSQKNRDLYRIPLKTITSKILLMKWEKETF